MSVFKRDGSGRMRQGRNSGYIVPFSVGGVLGKQDTSGLTGRDSRSKWEGKKMAVFCGHMSTLKYTSKKF